eukprot:6866024-Alexandrium_andersonii.AAC.1
MCLWRSGALRPPLLRPGPPRVRSPAQHRGARLHHHRCGLSLLPEHRGQLPAPGRLGRGGPPPTTR